MGGYDDIDAALRLAERADVVTYELEHISVRAATAVAERVPVRPGIRTLQVTQDRLAERRFLHGRGEPIAPWRAVSSLAGVTAGADALGFPLRLKAAIGGYDGRSQVRIAGPDEVAAAFSALGGGPARPLLLEQELAFETELSVTVAGTRWADRRLPGRAERARPGHPRRVQRARADRPGRRRRFDGPRGPAGARARRRGVAHGRAVPAAGRADLHQRAGATGAQLGPLDHRGRGDVASSSSTSARSAACRWARRRRMGRPRWSTCSAAARTGRRGWSAWRTRCATGARMSTCTASVGCSSAGRWAT